MKHERDIDAYWCYLWLAGKDLCARKLQVQPAKAVGSVQWNANATELCESHPSSLPCAWRDLTSLLSIIKPSHHFAWLQYHSIQHLDLLLCISDDLFCSVGQVDLTQLWHKRTQCLLMSHTSLWRVAAGSTSQSTYRLSKMQFSKIFTTTKLSFKGTFFGPLNSSSFAWKLKQCFSNLYCTCYILSTPSFRVWRLWIVSRCCLPIRQNMR